MDNVAGYIIHNAKKCLRMMKNDPSVDIEDLISEGYVCLDSAQKGWDESKANGCEFSTYFHKCLQNHYANIVKASYRSIDTIYADGLSFEEDYSTDASGDFAFSGGS